MKSVFRNHYLRIPDGKGSVLPVCVAPWMEAEFFRSAIDDDVIYENLVKEIARVRSEEVR